MEKFLNDKINDLLKVYELSDMKLKNTQISLQNEINRQNYIINKDLEALKKVSFKIANYGEKNA